MNEQTYWWIPLGLGAAFFETVKNVFSKYALRTVDVTVVSFATRFVSGLLLFPLLLWQPLPPVGEQFWLSLGLAVVLGYANIQMFMKSIATGDLSLVMPIMNFTPLFLLLTGAFFLGEFANVYGYAGVFFIVFGSYWLNLKPDRNGFWAPFRALITDPASRLMLIVAILSAITTLLDKVAAKNSSVLYYAVLYNAFLSVGFAGWLLLRSANLRRQFYGAFWLLLAAGISNGLSNLCHFYGITMTQVSYLISVKRTSSLFGVGFGYWLFGEREIRRRLVGAALMMIGVALIAFASRPVRP